MKVAIRIHLQAYTPANNEIRYWPRSARFLLLQKVVRPLKENMAGNFHTGEELPKQPLSRLLVTGGHRDPPLRGYLVKTFKKTINRKVSGPPNFATPLKEKDA